MKNGIDVSYAQGNINWPGVKTDFVYLKCNEGVNCIDRTVRANSVGAHMAEIPFGYYHFATLNSVNIVQDAKAEADDFIQTMNELPKGQLPPVLDIEQENKLQISPGNIELWITTFYRELQKAGHDMVLYSYTPWLNENLSKDHKLGFLKLWIAQYTHQDHPVLPFGWTDWWMWQWGQAQVNGIIGPVDQNRQK